MSFVYAKKIGKTIAIFADTKISFDQPDSLVLFSQKSRKSIEQFGMIKNIIISQNFCVSYAGNNIIYANDLLRNIRHLSLGDLLDLALKINRENIEHGAEFIICYANHHERYIYRIKDGKCDSVTTAWIGSYDAFNYFQGVRNGAYGTHVESSNPDGIVISFDASSKSNDEIEYQSLFDAFHKTIFSCGDNTVGGFVIPVQFDTDTNQFWYKGYMKSYSTLQKSTLGISIPMYQGPENGSFSVLFYNSPELVGIYIPENNWGIIYSQLRAEMSDYDITQTASFLIPHEWKISQLDFYVQTSRYGMKPPCFLGMDPDRIDDYLEKARSYRSKPKLAVLYIEKAIEIVTTQHRDEWRLNELIAIKNNIQADLNI